MTELARLFFDHSRHKLFIEGGAVTADVLAFKGEEALSEPFSYSIEFTSQTQDIAAEQVLGQAACFSLHALPKKRIHFTGDPLPTVVPLRSLRGVITGLKRLSNSRDEAHYQVTLQPRLALLGRGRQTRIYQQQSVPEIVEGILRGRHGFRGEDFVFTLSREYPRRDQVMQYNESDLAFIARLLAEVGIWYRFTSDDRVRIDVVEFHDDQRQYHFDVALPMRPPAGLSTDEEAVWQLQASHQVVEQQVMTRAYHHRDSRAQLDADVDQTRGAPGTYGEAYHYAEPYTELGNAFAHDEDLQSESGYFYARLRHERYLNGQTQLGGTSSSATLAPGQVLNISGGAPKAFKPGAVIVKLLTQAARDRSFEAVFEAIPYAERICFRPPLLARPCIAGTLPARVTSPEKNYPYGEIDREGRYRVQFLFDRDTWAAGQESLWMRLARPYAGETHGLHLPLIPGTEVAVAFEQGDPDRPYIAHALHDNRSTDHVTLHNYKRNVLRTPANNKLRLDDERGKEHIKLSTEHSGKSQLNLGHLVDAKRLERGEGFELRTDAHGVIRGGKGLLLSADVQPLAQGTVLDMNAALAQLNEALQLVTALAGSADVCGALRADIDAQKALKNTLAGLREAGLVGSAPAGIALTTPASIQLSASQNLYATARDSCDISVLKRFSVAAGEAISLFAHKLGIRLIAARGPVALEAQSDALSLKADKTLSMNSIDGEVLIGAEQGVTLVSKGAYIKIKDGSIELGAPGEIRIKNDNIGWGGSASLEVALASMSLQDPIYTHATRARFRVVDRNQQPRPFVPYRIEAADGGSASGVTDAKGYTQSHYGLDPQSIKLIIVC